MGFTQKDVNRLLQRVEGGSKQKTTKKSKKPVFVVNTKYPYVENVPTDEHELQSYCHAWRKKYYPNINSYSVPNGAYFAGRTIIGEYGKKIRISKEATKQIEEGLTKGVADYFVAVMAHNGAGGFYGGLYIEFKFRDGTQSPAQIEFQEKVEKAGYKYVIVKENETVLNSNNAIDSLHYFKKEFRAYIDKAINLT